METFTKDPLRSPSTGAIRRRPWRLDPFSGVRGGAGATPVSVGCAATNPTVLAPAPSGVTPAPPPRVHRVFRPYELHRELTAKDKEVLRSCPATANKTRSKRRHRPEAVGKMPSVLPQRTTHGLDYLQGCSHW
jgi:hypothetical protein